MKLLVGWLILLVVFLFQLVALLHSLAVTPKIRAPIIWKLSPILLALFKHVACLESSRKLLNLFVES
jgi:hypothetical protein